MRANPGRSRLDCCGRRRDFDGRRRRGRRYFRWRSAGRRRDIGWRRLSRRRSRSGFGRAWRRSLTHCRRFDCGRGLRGRKSRWLDGKLRGRVPCNAKHQHHESEPKPTHARDYPPNPGRAAIRPAGLTNTSKSARSLVDRPPLGRHSPPRRDVRVAEGA